MVFQAKTQARILSIELGPRVRTEPGRPKGPLRIDDVSASGCKVSWSEPEDDGGAGVQGGRHLQSQN